MNPLYYQAKFLSSNPSLITAPKDSGWEIAFAGRSNAGKSSAINRITKQKSLARTSKTPGRTQQLVFFQIDPQRRLVDLPGYGYAKVSQNIKQQWQIHMSDYLQQRQALQGLILLMDSRHPLTELDWQLIDWLQQAQLKTHILLTKADKLKSGKAKMIQQQVQQQLNDYSEFSCQLFSAHRCIGVEQAHNVLDHWFELGHNGQDNKKNPDNIGDDCQG